MHNKSGLCCYRKITRFYNHQEVTEVQTKNVIKFSKTHD